MTSISRLVHRIWVGAWSRDVVLERLLHKMWVNFYCWDHVEADEMEVGEDWEQKEFEKFSDFFSAGCYVSTLAGEDGRG